MVWGDEGEDGSNDTSIIATVTLDAEEVVEKLGENYTEEQARDLIWEEVDKINENLPCLLYTSEVQIVGKFDEQADHEEKERDTGAEGQRAFGGIEDAG